ncbi:hypothetical protein HK102_000355 [Quaeritorhiza haematococci]|nr:hypothetical protein HK102_000355 [Quaeritorhiza haematococci]
MPDGKFTTTTQDLADVVKDSINAPIVGMNQVALTDDNAVIQKVQGRVNKPAVRLFTRKPELFALCGLIFLVDLISVVCVFATIRKTFDVTSTFASEDVKGAAQQSLVDTGKLESKLPMSGPQNPIVNNENNQANKACDKGVSGAATFDRAACMASFVKNVAQGLCDVRRSKLETASQRMRTLQKSASDMSAKRKLKSLDCATRKRRPEGSQLSGKIGDSIPPVHVVLEAPGVCVIEAYGIGGCHVNAFAAAVMEKDRVQRSNLAPMTDGTGDYEQGIQKHPDVVELVCLNEQDGVVQHFGVEEFGRTARQDLEMRLFAAEEYSSALAKQLVAKVDEIHQLSSQSLLARRKMKECKEQLISKDELCRSLHDEITQATDGNLHLALTLEGTEQELRRLQEDVRDRIEQQWMITGQVECIEKC